MVKVYCLIRWAVAWGGVLPGQVVERRIVDDGYLCDPLRLGGGQCVCVCVCVWVGSCVCVCLCVLAKAALGIDPPSQPPGNSQNADPAALALRHFLEGD